MKQAQAQLVDSPPRGHFAATSPLRMSTVAADEMSGLSNYNPTYHRPENQAQKTNQPIPLMPI